MVMLVLNGIVNQFIERLKNIGLHKNFLRNLNQPMQFLENINGLKTITGWFLDIKNCRLMNA